MSAPQRRGMALSGTYMYIYIYIYIYNVSVSLSHTLTTLPNNTLLLPLLPQVRCCNREAGSSRGGCSRGKSSRPGSPCSSRRGGGGLLHRRAGTEGGDRVPAAEPGREGPHRGAAAGDHDDLRQPHSILQQEQEGHPESWALLLGQARHWTKGQQPSTSTRTSSTSSPIIKIFKTWWWRPTTSPVGVR